MIKQREQPILSVTPFVGVDKMFILYISIGILQIVNKCHDSTMQY